METANNFRMPRRREAWLDAGPARDLFPFEVNRAWYEKRWYGPEAEPRRRGPLAWVAPATAAFVALATIILG